MLKIIANRRSVRKYDSRRLTDDSLAKLKDAILRSPSSRNLRPWEFIFVDDRAMIEKLAQCKDHGSDFLSGAPLVVVIIGDKDKSDVWIEDCAIAAIILQLTAETLGLGSCWVQVRNRSHASGIPSEKYIQTLFHLPNNLKIASVIGIGYPAETKPPLPDESLDRGKIHRNRF